MRITIALYQSFSFAQIHSQFPLSFEFNGFYLKFLAYHHVSNRFRTFMMDSELRRMEAGWLLEEGRHKASLDRDSDHVTSPGHRVAAGTSVWEFLDNFHKKSPIFYNLQYRTRDHDTVKMKFIIFT